MDLLIILAHLAGFLSLLVASVWDLRQGEVPDFVFVLGIGFSLLFYRLQAWFSSDFDFLMWSLFLGFAFFVLGWLAYLKGVWGGADALALSLLGFASPLGLDGAFHLVDLVFNLMVAVLVYSVFFVFWRSFSSQGFYGRYLDMLFEDRYCLVSELVLVFLFTWFLYLSGLNWIFYLVLLLGMVFLYRFLRLAEDEVFTESVAVEDLDGGEVLAEEYSDQKIRGVSEEELENLDVETVEVRDGVRLVPVFLIAMILTDLNIIGFEFFAILVN